MWIQSTKILWCFLR
jgi:hypothetical protein